MIKVLTINSEAKSAKRLGLPTTIGSFEKRVELLADDIVIRWGNSTQHYNASNYRADFYQVVNPAAAIRANCDKFNSTLALSRVVDTPRLFHDLVPNGITAVVRPIEHSAGKDFKVKVGEYELRNGEYATEFIKTDTEVRVWFCGNATLCAKRVPMRDTEEGDFPCRSGWDYHFCFQKTPDSLHMSTLKAAKTIGLDCGAADILVKDGIFYFLELNSAPTIDKMRLEKFFKKNLLKLMQNKFGRAFERMAQPEKLNESRGENFFAQRD